MHYVRYVSPDGLPLSFTFRHGVPGGADRGPGPRDDGARRRQGGHHHLLLMRGQGASGSGRAGGQGADEDLYQLTPRGGKDISREGRRRRTVSLSLSKVMAERRTVLRLFPTCPRNPPPPPSPPRIRNPGHNQKWCSDEIYEDMIGELGSDLTTNVLAIHSVLSRARTRKT